MVSGAVASVVEGDYRRDLGVAAGIAADRYRLLRVDCAWSSQPADDAAASVRGANAGVTFEGLVIGSLFYSLPFAVQPLRTAFEAVGDRPLEIAATMGAGPLDRFLTVGVPIARRGFVSAGILVFAHTIGEFGVVLMVGGGIPGRTEVLSTRIYTLVESLQFGEAHRIAAALVAFAFLALFGMLLVERRIGGVRP